jgi:hypothetical protein
MKAIFACSADRESHRENAKTAVCFVLDAAHASHTIRVFMRDQGPGAVARPISVEEAWRLIEVEPEAPACEGETARKTGTSNG